MSTSRSVWICHRCTVIGAGPVTVTATVMPGGVGNQMSAVVARSGVVAREGGAA